MSAIWKYFNIETPASTTATCKVCGQKLARGGTKTASFTVGQTDHGGQRDKNYEGNASITWGHKIPDR